MLEQIIDGRVGSVVENTLDEAEIGFSGRSIQVHIFTLNPRWNPITQKDCRKCVWDL